MTPMPLFRMARASECQDIGNAGWRDVTALAADGRMMVRIDNYRPFDATVRFAAAGDAGLAPPQLIISQGPATPAIVTVPDDAQNQPDDPRLGAAASRSLAELRVNDRGDAVVAWLAWRSAPAVLWAKAVVDLNNPRRAVLCNWSRDDFFAQRERPTRSRSRGRGRVLRSGVDGGRADQRRRSHAPHHRPRRRSPGADRSASPDSRPDSCARAWDRRGASCSARRERARAAPRVIAHVWTDFEWDVPPEAWRAGLNRVVFESGDPAFPVGIAISRLSFSQSTDRVSLAVPRSCTSCGPTRRDAAADCCSSCMCLRGSRRTGRWREAGGGGYR